ncbi:DUF2500 domain-containing protein [Pseudoflavonifractor sp. 524-17]|uniref:DUF2500 domain-containing protein n=1 Tax=Pseudoflavonifractor sp. 524-17 TaxID=2304577 RepID=UPI0013796860|nr:DUF2500 domain-containing protein [Pseudoflavonifractor sp. 524-17]NCE63397.1 DUF2500 domain-containing protein [Pseudoflavonifractor sp. 524-17]
MGGFGPNFMFDVIPGIFSLFFVIVLAAFVVVFVKGIAQWSRSNQAPRLTVEAKVSSKRADVSHPGNGAVPHSSTTYYVTFQVESGDRMELHVSGGEYGMLAERDWGRLTFQGVRYLGFERSVGQTEWGRDR